jgi:predicted DNA-binding transcriptional regulator AlpA
MKAYAAFVSLASPSFELLTPAQAAPLLGLRWSKAPKDRVSFYGAISRWQVPRFKMGPHTVKFSRGDLEAWLASRRVGGASQ